MMPFPVLALLLAAATGAGAAEKADSARGKVVFGQCQGCHNANNTVQKLGPGLKGLYHKAKLSTNGQKPNDKNILSIIENGASGMPPYGHSLSAQQKADLLAYLKTL